MARTKMLHTVAHVKKLAKADDEKGLISAVVGSTEVLDRAGDVIAQDGWDLKNFLKNPVILWGHNVRMDRPPIGKAIKVWMEGKSSKTKKLMFDIQFDLQDSFAAEIYRKIKDGFVNTVSVGFIPLEREDNVFTKNELLELSFVPVPANPEALVTLRSAGLEPVEDVKDLFEAKSDAEVDEMVDDGDETAQEVVEEAKEDEVEEVADEVTDETAENDTEDVETETETDEEAESTDETDTTSDDEVILEPVEGDEEAESEADDATETDEEDESEDKSQDEVVSKQTIPYKNMGKAPEGEEWDGPGEMAKCETAGQLKRICAWYDNEKAENRGSYKLPHHKGGAEGNVAVWRGVAAAMAALLGARGGANLPENQRRGVYNHLAKHYEEFGKEAPAFNKVENQVLAGLDEEILSLILEREEKYTVRLLKKLMKTVKESKKEEKKEEAVVPQLSKDDSVAKAVQALKVIDQALTIITESRAGKE